MNSSATKLDIAASWPRLRITSVSGGKRADSHREYTTTRKTSTWQSVCHAVVRQSRAKRGFTVCSRNATACSASHTFTLHPEGSCCIGWSVAFAGPTKEVRKVTHALLSSCPAVATMPGSMPRATPQNKGSRRMVQMSFPSVLQTCCVAKFKRHLSAHSAHPVKLRQHVLGPCTFCSLVVSVQLVEEPENLNSSKV